MLCPRTLQVHQYACAYSFIHSFNKSFLNCPIMPLVRPTNGPIVRNSKPSLLWSLLGNRMYF